MSETKTFSMEVLGEDFPDSAPEGWEVLEQNISDHTRWHVHYEVIFQEPSQVGTDVAWAMAHSVGATESQDCDDVPDEIVAWPVVLRPVHTWVSKESK